MSTGKKLFTHTKDMDFIANFSDSLAEILADESIEQEAFDDNFINRYGLSIRVFKPYIEEDNGDSKK